MANVFGWLAQSGVVHGVIIGDRQRLEQHPECGRPGNGIFVRAAGANALPAVNVFEEAAYWTTRKDESRRRLSGRNDDVLRFAAGQLPPNDAFWSLTVTDVVGYMVDTPAGRHSIDDRSALLRNADGSIDIFLQRAPPARRQQNWLATRAGNFTLMLRAYLPVAAVLDGTYRVPPVTKAR